MFCSKCGNQIMDDAVVCVHCGCPTGNYGQKKIEDQDKAGTGILVLSFLIPIVGLIIYLIEKDNHPVKASSAGKAALLGFVVTIILNIITYGIIGEMLSSIL